MPTVIDQTTQSPVQIQQKTLDQLRYVQAGLSPLEALQATNFKEKISGSAVAQLKRKCKKYSLAAPDVAKLAHNQVRRILKGRAREVVQEKITKSGEVVRITEVITPTDSNILAAAAMVYDRYEPVKSQDAGSGHGNTYIDLSSYQIAVTPATTGNNEPVARLEGDKSVP